jgi:hypothetical protein
MHVKENPWKKPSGSAEVRWKVASVVHMLKLPKFNYLGIH